MTLVHTVPKFPGVFDVKNILIYENIMWGLGEVENNDAGWKDRQT